MQGRTVEIPGTPRLVADVYGPEGATTAVLFVHGFASTRNREKAVFMGETLSDLGMTFVSPDLQGHGDSGGRFEEISVGRSVDDLARVARLPAFASAPRRALAGSSFGGVVTAWTAVEHPGMCERLILLAPAFGFVDRYLATLPAPVVEAWRGGVLLPVKTDTFDVRLANDLLLDWERRDLADLARRLTIPTLILHGENDDSVPLHASEEFAAMCGKKVELHVIAGGLHGLNEHRDELARKMLAFLA